MQWKLSPHCRAFSLAIFRCDKGGSHLGLPTATCTLGQDTDTQIHPRHTVVVVCGSRRTCYMPVHCVYTYICIIYISIYLSARAEIKYLLLLQPKTRWDRLSVRCAGTMVWYGMEGATGMRQISGPDCDFLATSTTFHRFWSSRNICIPYLHTYSQSLGIVSKHFDFVWPHFV